MTLVGGVVSEREVT